MRIGYGTSVTVPQQSERWFSEVRAGRCFTRGGNVGGGVGQISEVQLFNPVASGITVIVYRVIVSQAAIDGIQCRTHNTALATLVGNGANLLSGGAVSVAEVRTALPAAADGALVSTLHIAAAAPFERIAVWAWELGAGEGILFANATTNIQQVTEFYWNEV